MKESTGELDPDLVAALAEADSQAVRLELLLIQIVRLLKGIKAK